MNLRKIVIIAALTFVPLAVGCGSDESTETNDAGQTSPDADASQDQDTADATTPEDGGEQDSGEQDGGGEDAGDAESTEDTGPDADASEDPCGNGTIDEGETCDGDCPTTCDDGNACTEGTLIGDPDECTAECEYEPVTECEDYEADYDGRYYILAEEKVGSSVVNSMECEGTFDANVDSARDDHLEGTAECTYSGGLTAFDENQSATITGGISPDGNFTAQIVHDFGTDNDGNFDVDGTLSGGTLTVDDTGSFYPNSQSAVAWDVTIELGQP